MLVYNRLDFVCWSMLCICLKMFLYSPPHNLTLLTVNMDKRKLLNCFTFCPQEMAVLYFPRRGQIKWVFDKTPDLQQPPHQDLECMCASESPHREIRQLCSYFCKLPHVCLPENSLRDVWVTALLQHLRSGKAAVHSKQSTEAFPQDSRPQRIHCSILGRPKAGL